MRTKKQEVDSAGSPFNTASVPLPSCRKVPTCTQGTYSDQEVSRRLVEKSDKISANISTIREWRLWASARLCRQDGKEDSECHSTISEVFQFKFWNYFGHSFGIVNGFGTVNIFCGRSQSVGTTFLARTSREWFKCIYFCTFLDEICTNMKWLWNVLFGKSYAQICKDYVCTENLAKKNWQDRNMDQENFSQKKNGQGNKILTWRNMKI